MNRRTLVLLIALFLVLPITAPATSGALELDAQEPIVVYLVRHSERAEDGTSDPVISLPGWDRSRLVSEMLRDTGLTQLHTTDYRRTRMTGQPTVEATGLPLEVYDARDLSSFAEQLRESPGRHLVIGHSNTTPQLVEALGGDPGGPIEEMEYDRLYIVTLSGEGASTVLIRFGEPYGG
jgi:phosphohistidine phosphatase SixA